MPNGSGGQASTGQGTNPQPKPDTTSNTNTTTGIDPSIVKWGVVVILLGFALVGGALGASMAKFTDANSVVAVVGAVTGVVGTVVTGFLGIHATATAGANATQKVADVSQKAAAAQKDTTNKAIAVALYAVPSDNDRADLLKSLNLTEPPQE